MKRINKKKCRHCRRLFDPDPRNHEKQLFCRRSACRKASKSVSQKKWLNKPENENYFKGPDHVKRVQEWRRQNPGYWKRSKTQTALQDHLIVQHIENTSGIERKNAIALQDFLLAQPPVIIGLISNFIGSPLQDDIANTLLAMQQSGQDILCLQSQNKGGESDCKNTSLRKTYPQGSKKLQLARSPVGAGPSY